MPADSEEKVNRVKAELRNEIEIMYYATPLDAAKKALGAESE